MLIQFIEDLSDRQLEKHLKDSLSAKLFCGFKLKDETPDFTCFSKLRKRTGTKRLADLFNSVRLSMQEAGHMLLMLKDLNMFATQALF